ncbi:MAG: preprotein translocase subunit SecY, partial [Pseudomonadota bacterium]
LSAVRLESIPYIFFLITGVVTLTGGTILLMWLGEQVTARGIGNGISLIIFAGIIAEMPRAIYNTLGRENQLDLFLVIAVTAMVVALILFMVFIERSQRRLLIQYPKRQQGNQMVQGQTSFLPLKINTSGVIPPIFASAILLLPTSAIGFAGQGGAATAGTGGGGVMEWLRWINIYLGQGSWGFIIAYSILIIFFTFFYTSIMFNPTETADNLRKYGGFIPGTRPGKRTAEYIDYVLTRLTVIGAIYLTFVCVLPELLRKYYTDIPFYLGGMSLLIVVSVTMDTVAQIQSHLIAHQYDGMIKRSRLGGRKK